MMSEVQEVSYSTNTHGGQRADVVVKRWTEMSQEINEYGELVEVGADRLEVEVKYDGFDGIAYFPYEDPEHLLSDLTGNHYQRQILTERRDQAGVDMPEDEFSAAITSVEADVESIVREHFGM